MLIFLCVIYFTGFCATTLGLSLYSKRLCTIIAAAVTASAILLSYPLCVKAGTRHIALLLNNYSLLTDICLLAIIESTVAIITGIKLIENHYLHDKKNPWLQLLLFPSLVLIILNTLALIYLFYSFSGVTYSHLAFLFAAGFFVVLIAASEFFRLLFRQWDFRIELKSLTALLQVVLAMFLPLLVARVGVKDKSLQVDVSSMFISCAVIGFVVLTGFIVKTFIPIERVPKPWRFLLRDYI
ncbi:MAG: hypothetical protein GF350_01170 [Chitinivibrionales bacterium]|nr:hypothetical protein [Chitinivibrionales bacterium]